MRIPVFYYLGLPRGSLVKNLPTIVGATGGLGLIPGSGRSPGRGNSNPLQYSSWDNPMYRGAWLATIHGVAKRHDQATEHTII